MIKIYIYISFLSVYKTSLRVGLEEREHKYRIYLPSFFPLLSASLYWAEDKWAD